MIFCYLIKCFLCVFFVMNHIHRNVNLSVFQDNNTNWLHAMFLKFMHFLNQTAETDWGQYLL